MADDPTAEALLKILEHDVSSLEKRLLMITESITALMMRSERLLSELEARMREIELRCAACNPRIQAMGQDLESLKGQSRVWGGVNSVAAIMAGLIGYFKQP